MANNSGSLSCPRCGDEMQIVLVVPAVARHPELTSYACRACGDVVTRADGDSPGAPA
jgi:predicted RNA-binding Zn-ribbon protein involved in translation (DUF1610 family)